MVSDPVAELKAAMNVFATRSTVTDGHKATDYSFDVKKTDSLVSPYAGTVEYWLSRYEESAHKWPDSKVTVSFAYQENKWVVKRVCSDTQYHLEDDPTGGKSHDCDDDGEDHPIEKMEHDQWVDALNAKYASPKQ